MIAVIPCVLVYLYTNVIGLILIILIINKSMIAIFLNKYSSVDSKLVYYLVIIQTSQIIMV